VDIRKLENELLGIAPDAYIFMNFNTFNAVATEYGNPVNYKLDGYSAEYIGHKIFINNDLDFGEIEIR
jgi:hypothetical protein